MSFMSALVIHSNIRLRCGFDEHEFKSARTGQYRPRLFGENVLSSVMEPVRYGLRVVRRAGNMGMTARTI